MRQLIPFALARAGAASSSAVLADPALLIGCSYKFGSQSQGLGIAAKVLRDEREERLLAAFGQS